VRPGQRPRAPARARVGRLTARCCAQGNTERHPTPATCCAARSTRPAPDVFMSSGSDGILPKSDRKGTPREPARARWPIRCTDPVSQDAGGRGAAGWAKESPSGSGLARRSLSNPGFGSSRRQDARKATNEGYRFHLGVLAPWRSTAWRVSEVANPRCVAPSETPGNTEAGSLLRWPQHPSARRAFASPGVIGHPAETEAETGTGGPLRAVPFRWPIRCNNPAPQDTGAGSRGTGESAPVRSRARG
jgi:hypothetical protein